MKEVFRIKLISKNDMEKLLSKKFIRQTKRGFVDNSGEHIGFYRTKGAARKRYIEDYFADLANNV